MANSRPLLTEWSLTIWKFVCFDVLPQLLFILQKSAESIGKICSQGSFKQALRFLQIHVAPMATLSWTFLTKSWNAFLDATGFIPSFRPILRHLLSVLFSREFPCSSILFIYSIKRRFSTVLELNNVLLYCWIMCYKDLSSKFELCLTEILHDLNPDQCNRCGIFKVNHFSKPTLN